MEMVKTVGMFISGMHPTGNNVDCVFETKSNAQ
jgi:hypothetical protein